MSTNYPNSQDSYTVHQDGGIETVTASDVNNLQDAVVVIENTLGSGTSKPTSTPTANAIVKYDANGKLPGDITGNAPTATNASELGGQVPSYYLAATAQAADSAKLNGQSASYYATALSVPPKGYEFEVASLFVGNANLYVSCGTSITSPISPFSSSTKIYVGTASNTASNSDIPTIEVASVNGSITYVLEVNLESATGGTTVYVGLWDATSNALVAGSTISTTTGTTSNPPTLRTGALTLTAGHLYAVTVWSGGANPYLYNARIVGQV